MKSIPRVKSLKTHKSGWALVTFYGGEVREIQWTKFARPGTVLAKLSDPVFADQYKLVDNGYTVEWPNGADWFADILYDRSKAVVVAGAKSTSQQRTPALELVRAPAASRKVAESRQPASRKAGTKRPASGSRPQGGAQVKTAARKASRPAPAGSRTSRGK